MQQKIVDAIKERHVLLFDYHGQPRQVNPHALGRVHPDNKTILYGWQAGGCCNHHGEPPFWGYFRLDDIEGLEVAEMTFPGPQPNYKSRFVNLIHSI